jgi:hypothetical protein
LTGGGAVHVVGALVTDVNGGGGGAAGVVAGAGGGGGGAGAGGGVDAEVAGAGVLGCGDWLPPMRSTAATITMKAIRMAAPIMVRPASVLCHGVDSGLV